MSTYALKLPRYTIANSVCVVAKNNPDYVLRSYTEKDVVLVSKDERGIENEWFVVSVDDDELIMVNGQKWQRYHSKDYGFKDTVHANCAPELFSIMFRRGYKISDQILDLLKTALEELFACPIFYLEFPNRDEICNWSSASVFSRYVELLEEIGKTVNDFVAQETIDNFFDKMFSELYMVDAKSMLYSGKIVLSPETHQKYSEASKMFKEISDIAMEEAIAAKSIHLWHGEWMKSAKYKGIDFVIRVFRSHIYVLLPYKNGRTVQCIAKFDWY